MSGLPMARLRVAAIAGAALLTGASVALAGVIGFVGLAAPHLVRGSASDDPAATLAPSAIAGAILLVLADLLARVIPTAEELRLGVVTALFGAPLFALIAWRAAQELARMTAALAIEGLGVRLGGRIVLEDVTLGGRARRGGRRARAERRGQDHAAPRRDRTAAAERRRGPASAAGRSSA